MRQFKVACSVLFIASMATTIDGFFNGLFNRGQSPTINSIQSVDKKSKDVENKLLQILENTDAVGGRGAKLSTETLSEIENIINTLESAKSIINPTASPSLDGCWKLLYTSSPGTNSPIQRTFTSFDGVSVYQVVNTINTVNSFLPGSLPDVSNTVCFGESARLRVTALASTVSNPLVVPRVGDGKIFGFNIFGISSSRAPRDPSERIDFAFQEARFEFKGLPFSVPYPVPFKLLGDEAKGWLDITYLSEDLRIARGNKGTIFVLKKADVSSDPTAAFAAQIDLNSPAPAPAPAIKNLPSSAAVVSTASGAAQPAQARKTSAPMVGTVGKGKGKGEGKGKSPERVVVVFPAQLGTQEDYEELSVALADSVGLKAYTAPLSRLDWPIGLLPSLLTKEYLTGNLIPSKTLGFYLKKVDLAVEAALADNPEAEIVLLAHSIGGWIARVWLSEWTTPALRARVRKLVTLGSPHNPPPSGSAMASIDQTRGLLRYITENFPGAYDPNVQYVSVIGTGVTGSLGGKVEAVQGQGLAERLESLVAYSSYSVLSGGGEGMLGDGIIPLACAELSGAEIVPLEGTKHSNFLPSPGKSIRLPLLWYGSEGVLDRWVQYLV